MQVVGNQLISHFPLIKYTVATSSTYCIILPEYVNMSQVNVHIVCGPSDFEQNGKIVANLLAGSIYTCRGCEAFNTELNNLRCA